MIRLAGVVLLTLLLAAPAQAQTENGGGLTAEDVKSFLPQVTAQTQAGTSDGLDLLPSVPCEAVSNPQVRERCVAALFAYYDYYTFGLAHRERVIWWQHISSRIIFAIVLALVVVGVYFAWRQFNAALTGGGVGIGDQPISTVEIGSKGVKVSSPVLGVIILTLSLGFFYLYLVFVYPIVEII